MFTILFLTCILVYLLFPNCPSLYIGIYKQKHYSYFRSEAHTLTLCIMMDCPIHINAISMALSIVYFKESQVEFSIV